MFTYLLKKLSLKILLSAALLAGACTASNAAGLDIPFAPEKESQIGYVHDCDIQGSDLPGDAGAGIDTPGINAGSPLSPWMDWNTDGLDRAAEHSVTPPCRTGQRSLAAPRQAMLRPGQGIAGALLPDTVCASVQLNIFDGWTAGAPLPETGMAMPCPTTRPVKTRY